MTTPVLHTCAACHTPRPPDQYPPLPKGRIRGALRRHPFCTSCLVGFLNDTVQLPEGKLCATCDRFLPVGDFGRNRSNTRGREVSCRQCRTRPAPRPDGRECTACGTFKPWSAYHAHAQGRGGHRPRCIACEKSTP